MNYVVGRSTGYSVSFSVREGTIAEISAGVAIVKSATGAAQLSL
ncbi:hypothetical protein [Pseudomonas sp. S11A4]|nr:hypothetical protein [Pseudomonas sp. S11A4]MCR8935663.1 hypothetical protein [Pseudomonas sp. S11A4]